MIFGLMAHQDTIPVTVDKSHLITIGERLYGEAVELIRELVNNAYDADATVVKVAVSDDFIEIEDNGSGMDKSGLAQYFNIGSTLKRIERKSPKFGRDRIGEFGIGKFATLSAAEYFEVWTKKGRFQARVIFDKTIWASSSVKWRLPLIIEEADTKKSDGTKVTLKRLVKKLSLPQVEQRIIESCPIKAPNFDVYLNGRKIAPKIIPGQRIPFFEGTRFGIIHGEIVISSMIASGSEDYKYGIECKVKHVTVKREFFGMENWQLDIRRVSGVVHADFLPITSDRSDFIKDSEEYLVFVKTMNRVMERVKSALQDLSDYRENRRTKRVLKEVLEDVKRALILNPAYCPEGFLPIGSMSNTAGEPAVVSEQKGQDESGKKEIVDKERTNKPKKRRKSIRVKSLNPTAVVRRLELGRQGISCCIEHLGPDGPECYTEGTIIFINRDHPLYKSQSKTRDSHRLLIARLKTQEISLMKSPRNPRQAFSIQSKLLKDALT